MGFLRTLFVQAEFVALAAPAARGGKAEGDAVIQPNALRNIRCGKRTGNGFGRGRRFGGRGGLCGLGG